MNLPKPRHFREQLRTARKHVRHTWHRLGDAPRRIGEGVLVALVVLQVGMIGVNLLDRSTPVLGLKFEGQPIGSIHNTGYEAQIADIIAARETKPLQVDAAGHTSTLTLRQLGEQANLAEARQAALTAGRTGNPFKQLADQNAALVGRLNLVPLDTGFNEQLAREYLTNLDTTIQTAPANAYFTLNEQQVVIHPDSDGQSIDTEAALAMLQRANPLQQDTLTLPVQHTKAAVTTQTLKPLLPEAANVATTPLTIKIGDKETTLSPEQLVGLLSPKLSEDGASAQLSFDEPKLRALIDEIVKQAERAPVATVMSGNTMVKQGSSGLKGDGEKSMVLVLAALLARQTGADKPERVDLPLATVDAPVVHQAATNRGSGSGLVRLTFDDGPGGYTDQILDILKRYNVHAAFYVVGRNVGSYPGQMQRTQGEGHVIGNHSYNHANLALLSRGGVERELMDTQNAIRQSVGVTPSRFRPPYGSLNNTVREVAANMGLSVDLWTIDTRDWAQPGSEAIKRSVLRDVGPGSVVLMHVLSRQTVDALPGIIEGIRAKGYTLE